MNSNMYFSFESDAEFPALPTKQQHQEPQPLPQSEVEKKAAVPVDDIVIEVLSAFEEAVALLVSVQHAALLLTFSLGGGVSGGMPRSARASRR